MLRIPMVFSITLSLRISQYYSFLLYFWSSMQPSWAIKNQLIWLNL